MKKILGIVVAMSFLLTLNSVKADEPFVGEPSVVKMYMYKFTVSERDGPNDGSTPYVDLFSFTQAVSYAQSIDIPNDWNNEHGTASPSYSKLMYEEDLGRAYFVNYTAAGGSGRIGPMTHTEALVLSNSNNPGSSFFYSDPIEAWGVEQTTITSTPSIEYTYNILFTGTEEECEQYIANLGNGDEGEGDGDDGGDGGDGDEE